MSISGRVLVNGEWRTRQIDIQYIMEQNRKKNAPKAATVTRNVPRPPFIAALSQTMISSPVIKWAFSAQIRTDSRADIVLVRERSIEIQELDEEGYLRTVCKKADFACTIVAAKILGDPKIERPPEKRGPLDVLIKSEGVSQAGDMELDLEGSTKIPPQMLILMLRSGRLDSILFLFAYGAEGAPLNFASYTRPLPAFEDEVKRLGRHLAVDPLNRAVAVGASADRFTVYSMKSGEEIEQEFGQDGHIRTDSFRPVKEERHVKLPGIISKMEFLSPSHKKDTAVYLAAIVETSSKVSLWLFEWDNTLSLRSMTERFCGMRMDDKLKNPNLLIPYSTSTGFILICTRHYAVLDNLLQDHLISPVMDLYDPDEEKEIREQSLSGNLPPWSAWARPFRLESWSARNEVIFLCRSDGVINLIELCKRGHSKGRPAFMPAGNLNISVGKAFAVLNIRQYGPGVNRNLSSDFILIAGDASDGGVYVFTSREDGEIQHVIPNWSPLLDFAVVPQGTSSPVTQAFKNSPPFAHIGGRDRIFACTGRGNDHGAVCEISSGIETMIEASVDAGGTDGYAQLWLFSHPAGDSLCLATSNSGTTQIHFFSPKLSGELEDTAESTNQLIQDFIYTTETTVALSSTWDDILIQITSHSIRATQFGTTLANPIKSLTHNIFPRTITKASIEPRSSLLLANLHSGVGNTLLLAKIVAVEQVVHLQTINSNYAVQTRSGPSEPSCVLIQMVGRKHLALVSTIDSYLSIMWATEEGLNSVGEHRFVNENTACEGLVLLSQDADHQRVIILCGLRSGDLHLLQLQWNESSVNLSSVNVFRFSVAFMSLLPDWSSIKTSQSCPQTAFAISSNNFYLISSKRSRAGFDGIEVHSIRLTDDKKSGTLQSLLRGMAQLPPQPGHRTRALLDDRIFVLDESHFHIIRWGSEQKLRTVTRRLPVGGSPSHIVWSENTRCLVVAFMENHNVYIGSGSRLIRFQFPRLKAIDPDAGSAERQEIETSPVTVGVSGETILSMREWTVRIGDQKYPMLLVSTQVPRTSRPGFRGSIHLFNLSKSPDGKVLLQHKDKMRREEPVYIATPYDHESICCGYGTTVAVCKLSTNQEGAFRWIDVARLDLHSQPQSITVCAPFIYVSSKSHSVRVLRLDGDEIGNIPKQLRSALNDTQSRNGLATVVVSDQSLVLASDGDQTVNGLWQPPEPTDKDALECLFEIRLPVSLTRLERASLSPAHYASRPGDQKSIIGSSLDGSLYRFQLLDEDRWRLLRFVQNLAERDSAICPRLLGSPLKMPLEPVQTHPHHRHVNGDVLARIIRDGANAGEEALRRMLSAAPDERALELVTLEERWKRLAELVRAALGEKEAKNPVEAVLRYLDNSLSICT